VLADFGAEVVQVARPDALPAAGTSAANLRRGKRQMVLDLRRADDLATVRGLLREADVVVDNFSRRVLPNFGLDDAALHALNPRLVIAHLPAFAADDPRADWVAFAPTLHALTGVTAAMRGAGGATAGPGFAYSDTASGWAMALAIVAALWRGGGAVIDLAQHDLLAMMLAGATPVPGAIHRCADEQGRERWCAIESDDPGHARGVRERRAEAVVAALQAAGVPAAVVATPADLAADPQLLARGWWRRIDGVPMDGVVPRLLG
jgi:crotonobetainyl-CoA:carnitine CoA-transferase CaiB-like acyl-CoA transferase